MSLPFFPPPILHLLPLSQAKAIQEVSEAESSVSTAARIQLDIAMQAPLIAVLLEEGSRGEGVGLTGEGVEWVGSIDWAGLNYKGWGRR